MSPWLLDWLGRVVAFQSLLSLGVSALLRQHAGGAGARLPLSQLVQPQPRLVVVVQVVNQRSARGRSIDDAIRYRYVLSFLVGWSATKAAAAGRVLIDGAGLPLEKHGLFGRRGSLRTGGGFHGGRRHWPHAGAVGGVDIAGKRLVHATEEPRPPTIRQP